MPFTTLSSVVQANSASINASLEKLSCTAAGVDEVDIYPAVLSALTAKGAPRSVALEVRAVLSVARQSQSSSSNERADAQGTTASPVSSPREVTGAEKEDSYMQSFNVGLAMSLHTVLLSRNRIGNLLGIVQFRHCVRLSLLGNRIRTIEDCEPLALLPDLQYLSLEFNPVAQLPHYRAHLLRICAWPHELTARTCRLRKLDSTPVTTAEVKHAWLCLQREMTLMPELLFRMQLIAFLVDVERRHAVHREMRQRGLLVQQPLAKVTLEATLERGAAYALRRVPVSGASHLVRLLVRDRHRLIKSDNTVGKHTLKQPSNVARTAAADDASTTATFCGSDDLDTSNITSVSSGASCSLLADASEGDARVLHSLSTLLGSKELNWSQAALRRADATEAKDACKEWSRDAFRQTLAFLDVRICAALLRLSRLHGSSLSAHEVDRLCQVWLHAVTHCASEEGTALLNVTGPRRLVTKGGLPAAPRRTQRTAEQAPPKACAVMHASPSEVAKNPQPPSLTRRLPVEAVAQVSKSVWEVGDQDGCLSASSASLLPVVSSDISDASADISMTSLSSESLVLPRTTAPQPTAADCRLPPRVASAGDRCAFPPAVAVAVEKQQHNSQPSPEAVPAPSSTALLVVAERVCRQRSRQRAFQQWCTSLRHRWQSRIADAYIQDKVSEAAQQPRIEAMRSPSWSGLLTHVTYLERKRGFFNCWRHRTEKARVVRAVKLERIASAERANSTDASLLARVRQLEEKCAADTQRSTKRSFFLTWKVKAEQNARTRCTAARRRVAAESPDSPETFLTLPRRSYLARAAAVERSPSSSPYVPRQLLEDLLKTTERRTNALPSSPLQSSLAFGFRRCEVAQAVPVKVTTWQSTSGPHKDASELNGEEGLSPVEASSSDGVSVNSVTTPFLPSVPFSPRNTSAEGEAAPCNAHASPRHRGAGHVRREPSPPPAIRILFPSESATAARPTVSLSPPPPFNTAAGVPTCGRSTAWYYGGTQPSRLPSTTAARRAIRTAADAPRATTVPASSDRPQRTPPRRREAAPYPAEDVEALVARSAQLEADRVFLLSEVRKLAKGGGGSRDAHTGWSSATPPPVARAAFVSPLATQDSTEERCATQQREIQRLESIASALRDERHSLLRSVKGEFFQY